MPLFYIKLISFNGLSFLFMRTFVALPLFSPAIVARSHATYGLKCGARAANRLPPHVADQCEPAPSLAAGVMARFPRRALPHRRRLALSHSCRCTRWIGGLERSLPRHFGACYPLPRPRRPCYAEVPESLSVDCRLSPRLRPGTPSACPHGGEAAHSISIQIGAAALINLSDRKGGG